MTLTTTALNTAASFSPEQADAWALSRVRAMPDRVVLSREQAAPEVGSVWVPRRTGCSSRTVAGLGDLNVIFTLGGCSKLFYCRHSTWHRWVRRTRAVRG